MAAITTSASVADVAQTSTPMPASSSASSIAIKASSSIEEMLRTGGLRARVCQRTGRCCGGCDYSQAAMQGFHSARAEADCYRCNPGNRVLISTLVEEIRAISPTVAITMHR